MATIIVVITLFFNEMDGIFPSQVVELKAYENVIFNKKNVVSNLRTCYPIMQNCVILLENVLSIVKRGIHYPIQKRVVVLLM